MQSAALADDIDSNTHPTMIRALPKEARQKYEALRRAELRARALADGLMTQAERLRELRDDAQRDLMIFDRRYEPEAAYTVEEDPATGQRNRVPAQFPERDALAAKVAGYDGELRRIAQEQERAALGFAIDQIDFWLSRQPPSTSYWMAKITPLKIGKGETLADALARLRQQQSVVREQLAAIESSPPTKAEMLAAMKAQVAALAERGRVDVSGLRYGEQIVWPTQSLIATSQGHAEVAVAATVIDAHALIVWANADALTAKLAEEIDGIADDANALDDDTRAARVAECAAALLQLQRQEEETICRLVGDGVTVRRLCVAPEVLLGIERA